MAFTPYLHFKGNCAEAMAFYNDVFIGTDLSIMRYADAPTGEVQARRSEDAHLVMHATLTTPKGALMASDFPPGMEGEDQQAVSVSWDTNDVENAKALFDHLLEGGTTIMPFGETFWSQGFGMVRDRFGTSWIISGPAKTMET